MPSGVVLEDGLTQDEAVALALWNNAAFQAILSELGIARVDLRNLPVMPVLYLKFGNARAGARERE